MSNDRRAVFQLLALGRISPAQAERLLAILSIDREAVWAVAACALFAASAQLHAFAPALAHLLHSALPALDHALTALASFLGGMS
jgi:hypothetical protein